MIDFGLTQASTSAEDKAVDLYVLERAVSSTAASSKDVVRFALQYSLLAHASPAKRSVRSPEVPWQLLAIRSRS